MMIDITLKNGPESSKIICFFTWDDIKIDAHIYRNKNSCVVFTEWDICL